MPIRLRSIPARFHVTAGDLIMFLSRFANDIVIRTVIELDGRVDEGLLRRALRLSLDVAPIAGCRFVDGWWRPHFQRLERIDETALLEVIPAGSDAEAERALERYLLQAFEPHEGPLVRAAVMRGPRDTLCIKTHHLMGDGAGVMTYLYALAETYAALAKDPDYRPQPILAHRSLRPVLKKLSLSEIRQGLSAGGPPFRGDPRWALALQPGSVGSARLVTRALPPERFAALRAYARAHGATVNDVLLAGWYRAVHRLVQPPPGTPLSVPIHINLRRRLPDGQASAIANLSQMVLTNIGAELGSELSDTVARVHAEMERIKGQSPSLGMLAMLDLLPYRWAQRQMGARARRMRRNPRAMFAGTLFNNVGVLDPQRLAFGAPVSNAYMTACVPTGAGLQVVACTCGGRLNLTALVRETGNNCQVLEQLLDALDEELPMSL